MNRKTIMIVDDLPENLRLLAEILRQGGYDIRAFPSGELALRAISMVLPDLILLDVNLPGIDGYEVCRRLRTDEGITNLPILFVSGLNSTSDKVRAFNAGGIDYVTKPFQPQEILARVKVHLELKEMHDLLASRNADLSKSVAQQIRDRLDAQVSTVVAMAKLTEHRDDNTGQHINRICALSRMLAEKIHELSNCNHIDSLFIDTIFRASALHDIGKVGVPDKILLKQGPLTSDEFGIIAQHTVIGWQTLSEVVEIYPNNAFLNMGMEIARSHHEKWDGSGYPDGLAGTAIPLSARIVAVSDVYDALRSQRPYKDPFSHDRAVDIILEKRAVHFDPEVVDAFEALSTEIDAAYPSLLQSSNESDTG
ncbi:MAG: HD domain-containing phosphohydrolase [Candidatus Thiodiazotropha endolucinida]